MKAHMPWGSPDCKMVVTLTREEATELRDSLSTSYNVKYMELYKVLNKEIRYAESVEAEIAAKKHDPVIRKVKHFNHHGVHVGHITTCDECDEELVQMLDGSYKHSRDAR